MGIAEEGLDAEGLVKPVMLGELVSVVEADGFAYRLWKFAELTSDGPGGEDSFSIDRVLNDAEAGLGLSGFPCVCGRLNVTPPWP